MALNTVPPSFSNLLASEPIKIISESGQKHFFVHSDILATQLEPLRSNKSVLEETKQIDLSEWDCGTVARFVEFLYIGNYRFPEPVSEGEEARVEDVGRKQDGESTPDTVQSLAGQMGTTSCGTNVLLVHAKVYAFAQSKGVEVLQEMSLQRLGMALDGIDGCTSMASRVAGDVIELLEYIYFHIDSHPDSPTGSEEPMLDLVSTFVSNNFKGLMYQREMGLLLSRGGDLVVELMEKVARRLPDAGDICDGELFCETGKKLCDMEREMQDWKNKATVSDQKVRLLEITNMENVQQLEAKVRRLEVTNVEGTRQLETANTKIRQLGVANTEKVQKLEAEILQLDVINAEKVQQLEAANAGMQKLEIANTGKVQQLEKGLRQLEVTNAENVQQLKATNTKTRLQLEVKIKQLEATNASTQKPGIANTEKVQQLEKKLRQLEAANVEKVQQLEAKLQQLEATNAEKVQKLEATSTEARQQLEAELQQLEAEKMRQLELTKARMQQSEAATTERLRMSRAAMTKNNIENVQRLEVANAEKVRQLEATIAEMTAQLEESKSTAWT